MKTTLGTESLSDTQLVEWSLTGDREAFGRIVERYQSLVCSITYGATGNLGLSEDIAQETFVTAWRELAGLRETTKLRAWLCGITRNLVNNSLRRGQHEPIHSAEPLDTIHEPASPEPSSSAQAITHEEEAILWRALERIPDTYREPLILFYREDQSVERVAEKLELSEDAVKQRLSRGRKLLTEEVAAFVEGTLKRTTPGKAFTLGVLVALPVFAASTSAATVGVSAAKGGVTTKAAPLLGIVAMWLGPIVALLGGLMGIKIEIEKTESPRERRFLIKVVRICGIVWALLLVGLIAFTSIEKHRWETHPLLFLAGLMGVGFTCIFAIIAVLKWTRRIQDRIRLEEASKRPHGTLLPGPSADTLPFEYRSRWTLLGLPLIHIRRECRQDGKLLPAKGWIAIGNIAYGGLFAFGGFAVAPVSAGGVAVGLVAVGVVAVGILAFAVLALGGWAVGGMALGVMATGGVALAWLAADGGVALARNFATGGAAAALHANDEVAMVFIRNSAFFTRTFEMLFVAMLLLWLPIGVVFWQVLRARQQPEPRDNTRVTR